MQNHLSPVLSSQVEDHDDDDLLSAEEFDEMCGLALKALRKPKNMTLGQIQEIAWAFLMLTRQVNDKPRLHS